MLYKHASQTMIHCVFDEKVYTLDAIDVTKESALFLHFLVLLEEAMFKPETELTFE